MTNNGTRFIPNEPTNKSLKLTAYSLSRFIEQKTTNNRIATRQKRMIWALFNAKKTHKTTQQTDKCASTSMHMRVPVNPFSWRTGKHTLFIMPPHVYSMCRKRVHSTLLLLFQHRLKWSVFHPAAAICRCHAWKTPNDMMTSYKAFVQNDESSLPAHSPAVG